MVIRRERGGEVAQDSIPAIRDNLDEERDPRVNTGVEDPRSPFQAGNFGYLLRTLVEGWNAAYRGRMPHGVTVRPATPGAPRSDAPSDSQFENNPDTFEDGTPVTTKEPELLEVKTVPIDPIPVHLVETERSAQFFTAYTQGVTATVDRIIPRQDYRIAARIWNAGPGIIYIAENESKGVTGLAIPVNAGGNNPVEIPTTREVWAVQQAAQSGPAQVGILLVFERNTT